ncbi:MAG: hydrogenase nickel incorporation protein HypB [Bacteroidetes bacterium]|nr:hydrogenase nickel incorporation protein HypB [Bacteroidota bacterium]
MATRIVEVRHGILKKNDELAHKLRTRFEQSGVFVVNLVSSPGSGKTALLEQTLAALSGTYRAAALVGDLATDNDATRLARSGAPIRQISTGTTCHLEAEMIDSALDGWDLDDYDILFIENVGNLVCPASYDLGENLRVVLFSTTEGEDKPLKYPTIFNSADAALLTKMDLAAAVEFDRDLAVRSIHQVRPELPILDTSARAENGLRDWLAYVTDRIERFRSSPAHAAESLDHESAK